MKLVNKKVIGVLLVFVMVIALAGCGDKTENATEVTEVGTVEGTETNTGGATEEATIAFICADMGNPSQAYASSLFEAYAKDYNLKAVIFNAAGDAQLEASSVQQAIAQGVAAIYVNPNDINAILPALQEAKDAGIIVGMFSSDVPVGSEDLRDFFVGVDDNQAGVEAANAFIANFPNGAKIVEVGGQAGHDAQIKRHGAFEPVISNSNIEVLGSQACDQWSTDQALAIMDDFIVKYGDQIEGVFCHWDGGLTGVIQALDAAGMDTKGMFLVGIDGSQSGVQQVKDGTQDLTIGQDFLAMSKKSLELTRDVLDGKTVTTQNFIPLMLVTPETIDDFTFPEW
jgi:ABC-type sugar transport system substrate-binding protein